MNKTEAAKFLGIGLRTLERYMTQNKVAFTRQRGKTGEAVVFEHSELERFKEQLYQPTHEAALDSVKVRQAPRSNSSRMVTSSEFLAEIGEGLLILVEGNQAILLALRQLANPEVPLHVKPLLTLGEAQRLSGLSRPFLLAAIRENRLRGDKIGKAWRVRRRDLERFVSKLF